jgi:hypothetical protein
MKYLRNDLRIWYIPAELSGAYKDRVLREAPTQKDKWYSADTLVLTRPPLSDERSASDWARFLFRGTLQEERYPDPEVRGGKIALIEVNQQSVQMPPNSLDHTHSSFLKQVAYSQRVFKAEDETASINTELADFLLNFSTNPVDQVVICVSAWEQIKRHEQAVAGQLWMQGDKKMSAANVSLPGMANDSDAALLTAVVEAVEWKHPLEPDSGPRPGQRVIIYPPELDQLQAVLSTDRSAWNVADGQEEACERIVSGRDQFEHAPMFFSSDQEELRNQRNGEKIYEWMRTASQIATWNRRQVIENGPDVMNSESDSDNEQHEDEILDGYVWIKTDAHGNPLSKEHQMETSQADRMRREAKTSRAGGLCSGVGPGSTDTRVANSHPSCTWVVIFSSAEVSYP